MSAGLEELPGIKEGTPFLGANAAELAEEYRIIIIIIIIIVFHADCAIKL